MHVCLSINHVTNENHFYERHETSCDMSPRKDVNQLESFHIFEFKNTEILFIERGTTFTINIFLAIVFNLFIARPTGTFRRLISDAKGPILNFALITLVVRYLRPHVTY